MDDFHRGLDLPLQPVILRQPQDVIDPFLFAPRYQLVIGKSAVSPNRDPRLGPSLPRKVDLFERSIRCGEGDRELAETLHVVSWLGTSSESSTKAMGE